MYEHGLPAVKLPKNILNGSAMLLMGFPDCGSSYFLLMQLDKDFKPVFNLLENSAEPPGKIRSSNDQSQEMRVKKIDISQMQMLEEEMTLSLLEFGKSHSFLPGAGVASQASGSGLPSDVGLEGSMQIVGGGSSFSSIVDEVFELERGSSTQNVSSPFNASSLPRFGGNLHAVKAGTPSPKWDGSLQTSQVSNFGKLPSVTSYAGSLHSSSNLKSAVPSSSLGNTSTIPGRGVTGTKLSSSKSEQDLASLRSPQSAEFSSMDVEQRRSSQLLSPPRPTGHRISGSSFKSNGPRMSPSAPLAGSSKAAASSPCATLVCKISYMRLCGYQDLLLSMYHV